MSSVSDKRIRYLIRHALMAEDKSDLNEASLGPEWEYGAGTMMNRTIEAAKQYHELSKLIKTHRDNIVATAKALGEKGGDFSKMLAADGMAFADLLGQLSDYTQWIPDYPKTMYSGELPGSVVDGASEDIKKAYSLEDFKKGNWPDSKTDKSTTSVNQQRKTLLKNAANLEVLFKFLNDKYPDVFPMPPQIEAFKGKDLNPGGAMAPDKAIAGLANATDWAKYYEERKQKNPDVYKADTTMSLVRAQPMEYFSIPVDGDDNYDYVIDQDALSRWHATGVPHLTITDVKGDTPKNIPKTDIPARGFTLKIPADKAADIKEFKSTELQALLKLIMSRPDDESWFEGVDADAIKTLEDHVKKLGGAGGGEK